VINELTRADATAGAGISHDGGPGRIIPRIRHRRAIARGEQVFGTVGCRPATPRAASTTKLEVLRAQPVHPPGNLRITDGVPSLFVDLTDPSLPQPRLAPQNA